jgi:hypothetical protein
LTWRWIPPSRTGRIPTPRSRPELSRMAPACRQRR